MPFKRNPISAEKIDSLGRLLAQAPRLAWDNAAHSLLERTLDDSANRRTLLPEAFLTADELLRTTTRLLKGLVVNEAAIRRNLASYGPFAALERLLMRLAAGGADRQEMHERLRQHAMSAWAAVQEGQANPLGELVAGDPVIQAYLTPSEIRESMNTAGHIGDAPQRARRLAQDARQAAGGDHLEAAG
jgi:adenylosuccinate lyase